jgi:hypothetical protein
VGSLRSGYDLVSQCDPLTRVVNCYLMGVSATDPVPFAGVPLVLPGVSAVASYLPARRAIIIDPVHPLRDE